jgi:histidine triad (HIT) family protein
MSSIFTKIINREIPGYIVAEDEYNIAFLDIMPLVKGHVLVVPKVEVDYLFDLDDPDYARLMAFVKRVARAQKSVITCTRIGVAVIGLEVPHAHIHLVPLIRMGDINFSRPKLKLEPWVMEETAALIRAAVENETAS